MVTYLMKRLIKLTCIAGMVILLMDCADAGSGGNKIKILSISPDNSYPLEVGKSYEFEVTVDYDFKQDNGGIVLGIHRSNCYTSGCVLANIVEPISNGKGKLTLKSAIIIPDVSSISVGTSMFRVGESHTSVEEYKTYKVVGSKETLPNVKADNPIRSFSALNTDSIKILDLSPDVSIPLLVGHEYTIEVTGKYVLTDDHGNIFMVIQRGDHYASDRPLADISMPPISKGNGKFTLKATITIPETNSIMVITPLYGHQNETDTSITDYRLYKVIK